MGTKRMPVVEVALLLVWSLLSFADAESHFCKTPKDTVKTVSDHCGNYKQKMNEGYNLDKDASHLKNYSDSSLRGLKNTWDRDPQKSPMCIFKKTVFTKTSGCCGGWEGSLCDKAICNPACENGGSCFRPMECKCRDGFVGPTCGEDTSAVTASEKYCYQKPSCFGERHKSSFWVMTKKECCSKEIGGKGWGLIGSECTPCSTFNSSDLLTPDFLTPDHPNVIPNAGLLKYHTCVSTGPNYFRTFDGIEYLFPGRCTYNLLEIDSLSLRITVTMINCHRFSRCRKRLQIVKGTDTVIIEGSFITINGDPISVTFREGYASSLDNFRIDKRGDYYYADCDVLRVRWNEENAVFITLETLAPGQLRVTGMCGNYNQNPLDDFVTPSGTKVTDPYEFGSSWAITQSTEMCQQTKPRAFTCGSPGDEKNAKDACGVLLQQPFKQCHDEVYVPHYYTRCVNDYCMATHEAKEAGDQDVVSVEEEQRAALCQTLSAYSQTCTIRKVVFSWRTANLCPRECPANMRYTECSPKCLQTCGNMQAITPSACDGECFPGCECLPGLYLNNSQCIQADLCPCEYQGQIYEANSKIDMGCNQCKCVKGQWKCTEKLCSKTCSVIGFQHFTTFDGATYDFHGPPCTYTLVELNHRSANDMHMLTRGNLHISQTVRNCESKKKVSCTAGVKVTYVKDLQKYEIMVDSKFEITVNDKKLDDYYTAYRDDNIYVKQATSLFALIQGPGFQVLYDRNGRIYIKLNPYYAEKVRGLCGDMDGSVVGELKSRRGIEESVIPFAMSFSSCPDQSKNAISGSDWCTPNPQDLNFQPVANKHCKKIGDPNIWGRCLKAVDWMQYRAYCTSDSCASSNPAVATCTMIAALSQQCNTFGFNIDWMKDKELFDLCNKVEGYTCRNEKGQFYTDCASPFGNCRDKQFPSHLPDPPSCIGGCMCRDQRLLDDYGVCSVLKECTCYDQYTKTPFAAGTTAKQLCSNCTCREGTWDCGETDCGKDVHCPYNQVYRKNVTNCGSTCETLDASMDVCEQDMKFFDGCGCKHGLVMMQNGTCVKPDECPCNYNGKDYKSGSVVTVGCIIYQCVNHIWVKKSSVKNCKRTCMAYGDPHYLTFDGFHYSFQGGCEYILVRSKGSENFSVLAENMACGSTGATCTKIVTIKLKRLSIKLTNGMQPLVNGKVVNPITEFKFEEGSLYSTDLFTIISLKMGMDVTWDGHTQVFISLSDKYKKQVEGLCGNYDDVSTNEFDLAATSRGFSKRWKTSPTCPEKETPVGFDTCEKNKNRARWAEKQCKIITDGPVFAECRKKVTDFKNYFKNCRFDACGCDEGGDCECLCTAVSAFAKVCSDKGVHVKWRSNNFCPMMCGNGMNYDTCISPCRPTCDDLVSNKTEKCQNLECVEGCICPEDMVLNDIGECVQVSKCTCKYQGHQFNAGTVVEIDCQRCLCTNGRFVCTGNQCGHNCTDDEFACPIEGRCIPKSHVCDSISDCLQNKDEVNCTKECEPDEFACTRLSQCVPQHAVCNGHHDCKDGSDESNCAECKDSEFYQCKSTRCIPQSFVCDGKIDCGLRDLSDEGNCTEQCDEKDFFRCENNKCLPKLVVCDEVDDCGDGTDERACSALCPPGHDQVKYRHGVAGFRLQVSGLETRGEDLLLGSGKSVILPGKSGRTNTITIVHLNESAIFSLVDIEVNIIGAKSVTFELTHSDGRVESFEAKHRNKVYFLDVAYQSRSDLKMVALKIENALSVKVENLFMVICVLQAPVTLPPSICPYGFMPVFYDYDDDSFVTLVDKQRSVDVLDGSGRDVKFDDSTEHQIIIRRDKPPKSFNINYIGMTVIGAGNVTLTVTDVLGHSASKTMKVIGEQKITFDLLEITENLDGELLSAVITFKIVSASMNIECLTMSACLSSDPCANPFKVNYKGKKWRKSVRLTSNDDATFNPDVSGTLKGSSVAVPNLRLKPGKRYNYSIDFLKQCPTNYLVKNITFLLGGVRDVKLLIGREIVFNKSQIDEKSRFEFKLPDLVMGNSISLVFVANKSQVTLYNVEVELCCTTWMIGMNTSIPERKQAGKQLAGVVGQHARTTPSSKSSRRMCSRPMAVNFLLAKRYSIELLTSDHLKMDGKKSLRGSPTKRWTIPSNVTGPFSIVLMIKEQCRYRWNIEEFMFTLEGVKEFSVTVGGRSIIKSEKVKTDSPFTYRKKEMFHGNKFTLDILKRGTTVKIYDVEVCFCCESKTITSFSRASHAGRDSGITEITPTLMSETIETVTVGTSESMSGLTEVSGISEVSDFTEMTQALFPEIPCSDEPEEITFNSTMLFNISLYSDKDGITMDANDVLRDSPVSKWTVPSEINGQFRISLVMEEYCESWQINHFQFNMEGVSDYFVYIGNRQIRTPDKNDSDTFAPKFVGMAEIFHGSNFTLVAHKVEKEVLIYNLSITVCCVNESRSTLHGSKKRLTTLHGSKKRLTTFHGSKKRVTANPALFGGTLPSEAFESAATVTEFTASLESEWSFFSGTPFEAGGSEGTTVSEQVQATTPPFQIGCWPINTTLQQSIDANGIGCTLREDNYNISHCHGNCESSFQSNRIRISNATSAPKTNLSSCNCCSAVDINWINVTVECIDGPRRGPLTLQIEDHVQCRCTACQSGVTCLPTEFQCNSDKQCIDGNKRCNGKSDCQDGSDELSCGT